MARLSSRAVSNGKWLKTRLGSRAPSRLQPQRFGVFQKFEKLRHKKTQIADEFV
jgi:hypothetical protein